MSRLGPCFCDAIQAVQLDRSTLIPVRRLVALVLAPALVISSTMVSSLHVHEYIGHDHPAHHHGPASHEHGHSSEVDQAHDSPSAEENRPSVNAESCDPGRHAVAVKMGCAQLPQVHVDLGELPRPTIVVPSAPIRSAPPIRDVRVHGPPFAGRIHSRGPPLTHPA